MKTKEFIKNNLIQIIILILFISGIIFIYFKFNDIYKIQNDCLILQDSIIKLNLENWKKQNDSIIFVKEKEINNYYKKIKEIDTILIAKSNKEKDSILFELINK